MTGYAVRRSILKHHVIYANDDDVCRGCFKKTVFLTVGPIIR